MASVVSAANTSTLLPHGWLFCSPLLAEPGKTIWLVTWPFAAGDGTAAGGNGEPIRLRKVVVRAREGLETAGFYVPAKIGGTPLAYGALAAGSGSCSTDLQL